MSSRAPRPWEVLRTRTVYEADPWLKVQRQEVRLPDGRTVDDYHRVELPDCAIVCAEAYDGRVVMVRMYNHGPGAVDLTLPAGALHDDEAPLVAANRELLEETGYAAAQMRPLGTYWMNGNYGCGRAHLFHAAGAQRVAAPDSGDLEEMEVVLMTRQELARAVLDGKVPLLAALAGIALALWRDPVGGQP